MVKVSFISVTYNNEDTIEQLIQSIERNMEVETEFLVVDNNSTDKTVERIGKYPKIKLIRNTSNLGYAKANNKAAKKAEGEYLFFLNPDATLDKKIPTGLLKMFERDESIGIIAPKIMSPEGEQKSVRKLPTLMGAIREYYFNQSNQYEEFVPVEKNPTEVESVVGAAFIIPRELFIRLGGFDERFFLYFEDLDFCRRVRAIGRRIIYVPDFIVYHLVGYSKSESKEKWLKESARKYHGFLKYLLLTLILKMRPKKPT